MTASAKAFVCKKCNGIVTYFQKFDPALLYARAIHIAYSRAIANGKNLSSLDRLALKIVYLIVTAGTAAGIVVGWLCALFVMLLPAFVTFSMLYALAFACIFFLQRGYFL